MRENHHRGQNPIFAAGGRVDFFHKAESNRLAPENFNVHEASTRLDRDMTLAEIIALAPEVVGARGSARAGTFEIQTDEGIISHSTGKNLVHAIERGTSHIVFKTWDELEAEEAA